MGETERKREQQIREKKKQRETRREAQVECAAKVKMTQSAGQNRRTLWHPVTHTHTLCCSPKHTHTLRYTVAHGGTHKLWKMAASQLDSVLITLNLIFISGSASLFIFCAVVVVLPLSPPLSPFSLARTIALLPAHLATFPAPASPAASVFLAASSLCLLPSHAKPKEQRWLGAVSRLSPAPPFLCPSPLRPHMAAMP